MLAEGIILIILGWLALFLPIFAPAIALNTIIGWLFVVSGFVGLVTTAGGRHAPGFWWSLLSAILAIVVGATLMEWPAANSIPVTYLLTIFFVIEGIATIMYALDHRRELSGRWEWMVASGCVDLALAALVVLGLPGTAPLAIGFSSSKYAVWLVSYDGHGDLRAYCAVSKILSSLSLLSSNEH